jgi:hypothetical protein
MDRERSVIKRRAAYSRIKPEFYRRGSSLYMLKDKEEWDPRGIMKTALGYWNLDLSAGTMKQVDGLCHR